MSSNQSGIKDESKSLGSDSTAATDNSSTIVNPSPKINDVTLVPPAAAANKQTIEKQAQRRIFKIIVIGDSNVGKTCLTYRFCSGKFPNKTEATIGVDFRERTVEINGDIVKLQLWDTAGQERFRKSMVQHYYRNVHAVVFVYDVTKISSFDSMPGWIEECDHNNLTRKLPRILVGNKCDMVDRVAVNTNAAQRFADAHSMPLFETSAKDDERANHIESIFMTLAHKLQQSRPMMRNRETKLDTREGGPVITIGQQPTGYGLQPGPAGGVTKDEKCAC